MWCIMGAAGPQSKAEAQGSLSLAKGRPMTQLYASTRGQHHPPKVKGRFEELDALRGLAAISVFLSHASGLVDPPAALVGIENSPVHVLWEGAAAVDLFFVLSGFVLALPYVSREPRPLRYDVFLIKRIFRLYPAYWVAVLFGLALMHFGGSLQTVPYASEWLASFWHAFPSCNQILRTISLIGPGINTNAIDPAIWSLVVEMRMSLIFPLLVLVVGRLHSSRLDAAAVVASIILGAAAVFLNVGLMGALPHFVLGIVIAKHRDQLTAWVNSRPVATAWGLGVIALLLYGNRAIMPSVLKPYNMDSVAAALGSSVLVVLVMSRGALTRFLHTPVCNFYGRISYSFYLTHLPIMLFAVAALWRLGVPVPIIVLVSLVATTAVAAAMFFFIEVSFQRLGHLSAGRLAGEKSWSSHITRWIFKVLAMWRARMLKRKVETDGIR